jgi:hypothetical protein
MISATENTICAVEESCRTSPLRDAADGERLGVVDLLARHEPRAHGAEGVGRLAAGPLAVGELQVAGADVVDADVAPDRVERLRLADPAGPPPDHDAELGLVVDLPRLPRG